MINFSDIHFELCNAIMKVQSLKFLHYEGNHGYKAPALKFWLLALKQCHSKNNDVIAHIHLEHIACKSIMPSAVVCTNPSALVLYTQRLQPSHRSTQIYHTSLD